MERTISGLALSTILVLLPVAAQAELSAPERLMQEVYAEGGETLYCQREFGPDSNARADYIYPERRMRDHFDCRVRRLCLRDERYVSAVNDLHNLYFVRRSVEIERRGTRFGELPGDPDEDCGYRAAFQTFEPPDHAKGPVARSMLYMHVRHELPIIGSSSMMLRWAREFPPTEEERMRNERIEAAQGNRNPFIDDPGRLDELILE